MASILSRSQCVNISKQSVSNSCVVFMTNVDNASPQCRLGEIVTKARLRRVTPLGRPRSIYKSNVERHFMEFWVELKKWAWRSRVSHDACLVQIWWLISAQICDELSYEQAKVYRRTDGQTQATTIPLWPERLRVKSKRFRLFKFGLF